MGRSTGGVMRRARHRRASLGATVSSAVVACTLVALVSPLAAGAAGAATGPGTAAVTPGSASASSAITVQLRYTASSPGLAGGVITVTIPRGWTEPQKRAWWRAGFVTASAGRVQLWHRRIRVSDLNLCAGCSMVVSYLDARAPSAGRATFFTKSAHSAAEPRKPVAAQPALIVSGGSSGGGTSGGGPSGGALGDYAGYADPAGITSFAQATGTHPTVALDYLDRVHGWAAMDSAGGMKAWSGSGYRLVLGVPIIPADASGNAQGSLAGGAAGSYDGYFSTLGQNLVRQGLSNSVLRLGWEFNGTWFPWSVQSSSDAANFAAYWRQIVTTMRSVPGEHFTFFWNPNAISPTGYSPSQAYPGDAYVDYVGTDAYDDFWGSPFTPQAAWANQLSEQWGLDWLASFAAAHGKAIAIGEWSASYRSDGHGLGDDPYYVDKMAAWLSANHAAFSDIFSFDTGSESNDLLDGSFPNALGAFERDFAA
jgi:hypothetical protein